MKLRDLLVNNKPMEIKYRINSPVDEEGDMLFGYCRWTGSELESGDGDSYYLDDEIERYEINGTEITVWIRVNWIRPEEMRQEINNKER